MAAVQRLPAFPRFVLAVFEPISLLSGAIPAMGWPEWFNGEQIFELPGSTATTAPVLTETSRLVTKQLGSTYGIMAAMAIAILYTTSEPRVVKAYIVALWLGDISHVLTTFLGLGYERGMALGAWNAMTWGNIGITLFLFLTRTLYLLGLFGPDREPRPAEKNKVKKAQ